MNPPQFTLKLIVFIHFVLTIWSMNPFLGICYVYMNLLHHVQSNLSIATIHRLTEVVFRPVVVQYRASMNPFLGICYVYMNLLVLCIGLWSIAHHESSDSILMFFACHLFSILQDIILLGLNEPRGYQAYERGNVSGTVLNEYRFSLGMSVLNLIIKPVTAFLMYRIYRERGGNYTDFAIPGVGNLPGFGGAGSGGHHGAYENLETPSQPQPMHHDQPPPQQTYSDNEKPPLH